MSKEKPYYLVSELKSVTRDELEYFGSEINTTDKFDGKYVWDVTDSVIVQAKGNSSNSEWIATDNSITIVPK